MFTQRVRQIAGMAALATAASLALAACGSADGSGEETSAAGTSDPAASTTEAENLEPVTIDFT